MYGKICAMWNIHDIYNIFFLARQTSVGHGLLIHEVSRSHDAPQLVGFLWTSDQLVAETSTWQLQHSQQTSMPPVGFKPTISAGERPQTNVLERAANGTGILS